MRLALIVFAVLLLGCVGGPEPTATPQPTATPTATIEPTATPQPNEYSPATIGETIQRGDFEVELISSGPYSHTSPLGERLVNYRVDMKIKNPTSEEHEYNFRYVLFTDEKDYPVRWYSTIDDQGMLAAGGEVEGYVLFEIDDSTGPFQLTVVTLSLSRFDYLDVIGVNELDKPVAGARMYEQTCGTNALGEAHLGDLLGSGACDKVSAARDLYIYPFWVRDGIVNTKLKLKNSNDFGIDVFVVDEIPESFGVKAQELTYSSEPIFLDDYHPAWFVHLSRNEIWKMDINYTIFLETTQVEFMDPPVVLAVVI